MPTLQNFDNKFSGKPEFLTMFARDSDGYKTQTFHSEFAYSNFTSEQFSTLIVTQLNQKQIKTKEQREGKSKEYDWVENGDIFKNHPYHLEMLKQ